MTGFTILEVTTNLSFDVEKKQRRAEVKKESQHGAEERKAEAKEEDQKPKPKKAMRRKSA